VEKKHIVQIAWDGELELELHVNGCVLDPYKVSPAVVGRNEVARRACRSIGTVSKVARELRIYFPDNYQTAAATEARRIDMEYARSVRELEELERQAEAWQRFAASDIAGAIPQQLNRILKNL